MPDQRMESSAPRVWIPLYCGFAVGFLPPLALAQADRTGSAGASNVERTIPGTNEQPLDDEEQGGADPVIQDDMVSFSAFSDAIDLVDLVDMIATILDINVNIDPSLSGEVMFNKGFSVHRDQLLDTLNSLLEQNGFFITPDPKTGFFAVLPDSEIPSRFDDGATGLETTRLIPTGGVRPSALQNTINAMLGLGSVQPGQANNRIAYLDDASLIAVTGPPGRIAQIQSIVDAVISEYLSMQFVRFELVEIAAPVARDYIISIVTGQEPDRQSLSQNLTRQLQQQNPGQFPGLSSGSLDSIPDRLRVDPVGNALLFRGRTEELGSVQTLIALIDKPSTLSHKKFFTGSATMTVAQFASSQGLGEVVSYEQFQGQQPNINRVNVNPQANIQNISSPIQTRGGPVLVVDETRGFIIHYATSAQHNALENLVEQLDAPSEEVVIRAYKLQHAVAIDVADLLTGILQEQQIQRDDGGSLLPQNQGPGNQAQPGGRTSPIDPDREQQDPGEIFVPDHPDAVFVVADVAHNQVLVKASVRQQREVAKLVQTLDIRQAQVYLDVKIVSISDSDTFRLAIESQLINAGGQPVVQTDFGLTTPGEGGITVPRIVSPGLGGFTTAVILSDQLPFVLNAIQTVTDAKVLANPTLLVNDNADGRIEDTRQEPFTVRTIGDGGVERQSVEFADAGTIVEVTPRISSGGYLTLEYLIDFSNFIGESTGEGQPPPINRRIVNSVASLPTDSTMVLGGITVDNLVNTVIKVPFFGDIPIFGHLFRDTSRTQSDSVLYIFITPKILRDRTFAGHRLIAEGPMKISDIAPDAPPLEPVMIPIIERRITMPGADPALGEGG